MRRILNQLKRGVLHLGTLAHQAETTDGLVLFLVFAAGWWMAAQQGGARDEALPNAMRLMLAAVTIHGASLLIRREQGLRISLAGLIFLPYLVWLLLDALFIAPDRGLALHGFVVAGMLTTAWYLVLHHARRTWSYVTSLTLLGTPAALLACGVFDHDDRRIRGLLGVLPNPAYAGHFISALGSPAACAAVLLLALMPTLALSLNPGIKPWMRIVAAYFGGLLILGLFGTHHGWAWIGLGLGLAAMLWLLCRSLKVRLALAASVAMAGWLLFPGASLRVGILRPLTDDPTLTPWLARATGQSFLAHPILGGGQGSFPLSFEATRPASWQTDPASCGSLLLQTLCEHGILGALLVLIPLGWITWRCLRHSLARNQLGEAAITATGGHRRLALRRSLCIGLTSGSLAAALTLAIDYPCSLPGILLLLIAAVAIAFRLSQENESSVIPDRAVNALAYGCLVVPVLVSPLLLSPLHSAALSAQVKDDVAAASPANLASPPLLSTEAHTILREAEEKLEEACRLNPLASDTYAWHAQALALLIRQTPQDAVLQARARQAAETAVQLNPRSPWAHSVLGSILLGAHDPKQRAQGLEHVRVAAELAPMNQAIALRLAQALGQTGAPASELRTAYERAQLTNPTRADVRDKLVLLKSSGATETPTR